MSHNRLVTLLSRSKHIHGYFTETSLAVKKLQTSHGMNNISSLIFSRAVNAAALLSGNLKNQGDMLRLIWNCTGPVKDMAVEIDFEGNIRGFIGEPVLPYIEDTLVDGNLLADRYLELGEIRITRLSSSLPKPYHSVIPIERGEIAEDMTLFLKQSLQIESAINIGVSIAEDNNIEVSGGLCLMALPQATDEDISILHSAFTGIESLTDVLRENNSLEMLLENQLSQCDLEVVSRKKLGVLCHCSRESIEDILLSLPQDEFVSYIKEDGMIAATCEWCGKQYHYSPKEIEERRAGG